MEHPPALDACRRRIARPARQANLFATLPVPMRRSRIARRSGPSAANGRRRHTNTAAMSIRRIFENFNRLARSYAPEFLVGDHGDNAEAKAAREVIEASRREEAERRRAAQADAARRQADPKQAPQAEAAKPNAPQPDPPKPEAARQAAPKQEPPRQARTPDATEELRKLREEVAAAAFAVGRWTVAAACAALGLPANAAPAEITAAYRALIVRYHPDRADRLPPAERAGAQQRALMLNGAYAFLKAQQRS